MANIVTISGMFGAGHTYFSDSPVVITIENLYWGGVVTSPFTVVRVKVVYDGAVVGDFRADTGGQTSISFDISSALRAIWAGYDFSSEVSAAAVASSSGSTAIDNDSDISNGVRSYRSYTLRIYTEYLSSDGIFTTTQCTDSHGNTDIPGGQCLIGAWTEWERYIIERSNASGKDVSVLENTGLRCGDASTKPTSTPERVGIDSITSWVDVQSSGTQSVFYAASAEGASDSTSAHAPMVLRDSQRYVNFLFVNRRGAVETCSAMTKEAMSIDVNTDIYRIVDRPSFSPSMSITAIPRGGRRSWSMSSGYQTRDWCDWWSMEFLLAKRWWMRVSRDGTESYVPVVVEPSKSQTEIYNLSKQDMCSVDFTVTMAIDG